MICPHGCSDDAPTVDYLAAHITHVHGVDKNAARWQAEQAFTVSASAPPKETTTVAKKLKCSKCQEAGHNARSCGKAASPAPPPKKPRTPVGDNSVRAAGETYLGHLQRIRANLDRLIGSVEESIAIL